MQVVHSKMKHTIPYFYHLGRFTALCPYIKETLQTLPFTFWSLIQLIVITAFCSSSLISYFIKTRHLEYNLFFLIKTASILLNNSLPLASIFAIWVNKSKLCEALNTLKEVGGEWIKLGYKVSYRVIFCCQLIIFGSIFAAIYLNFLLSWNGTDSWVIWAMNFASK